MLRDLHSEECAIELTTVHVFDGFRSEIRGCELDGRFTSIQSRDFEQRHVNGGNPSIHPKDLF